MPACKLLRQIICKVTSFFGLLALVLACVGLYGPDVISARHGRLISSNFNAPVTIPKQFTRNEKLFTLMVGLALVTSLTKGTVCVVQARRIVLPGGSLLSFGHRSGEE